MGRREGLLQSDNPAVDLLPLPRPWKGWTYTITKENGAASRPLVMNAMASFRLYSLFGKQQVSDFINPH